VVFGVPNIRVSDETLKLLRKVKGVFQAQYGNVESYDRIIGTMAKGILDFLDAYELIPATPKDIETVVKMMKKLAKGEK
jgi:hypothetical protein